jgi:hypothetical protein
MLLDILLSQVPRGGSGLIFSGSGWALHFGLGLGFALWARVELCTLGSGFLGLKKLLKSWASFGLGLYYINEIVGLRPEHDPQPLGLM